MLGEFRERLKHSNKSDAYQYWLLQSRMKRRRIYNHVLIYRSRYLFLALGGDFIQFKENSHWLKLLYGSLMIMATTAVLGILSFNAFWHYDKVASRFFSEVTFMRQHVRELMAQNESILTGFSAFLVGSRVADIAATRTYAQRMLDRYPHILMFEVAQRVDQDHLEPFTSYLNEQGIIPPRIWSFNYEEGIFEHNIERDGEAFPVIFIEPKTESSQLGLDISSIEFVHNVVQRFGAREQLLMSEPFELLDGEIAIVMMQGVNVTGSDVPRYVSLLMIKAEQLIPNTLRERGWDFSLSSKDGSGKQFDLMRTENSSTNESWLPELTAVDNIKLTDFELSLEIKQQLTMDDFDWLYILGMTLLMFIFPVFVIIMYRVHQGIEKQNSLKRQELYHLANFDNLTGLANRFHFEDFGNRILSTVKRNQTEAALFFIDLNGFKLVNDQLGHGVGDIVLKRVAETLLDNVRQGDIVARIGGDEFAILTDQIPNLQSLMSMLNKIREAIMHMHIAEIKEYKISGSVGFSYTEYHGHDLAELLKIADNSMYGEKQEHYKTS
jgi:diguanylate cyclase (GGDEF)-like protein